MKDRLSEKGKDLVKYMPEAVNALAEKIIGKFTDDVLYGERPMTNYERLVSVPRAELAYFMMRTTDCPCIAKETGCCRSDISCQKAWLDWLNKEAHG